MKSTQRAHGTTGRYKRDGCRCEPCSQANRTYNTHRARQIAYGRWQPYVAAEPVRQHVRMLGDCGFGWKHVAALAGVSSGVISKMLYGLNGKPPSRGVRRESADKILAVRLDIDVLPGTARVTSAGSRRRIQALCLLGWSVPAQARLVGMGANSLHEVLNRPYVCASTARAIRDLADRLWNQQPPQTTKGERVSAAKTRAHAQRNRWLPLAAWDDDLIDLPDTWLDKVIKDQVAEMDMTELARCDRARRRLGERSPLVVAAALEYNRRRSAQSRGAA